MAKKLVSVDDATYQLPPLVLGALDSRYTPRPSTSETIFVSRFGNDSNDGRTVGTALATLAAAVTAMGSTAGTIVLGYGNIPAGSGVAWSATSKCGLVGQGKSRTTIVATAQVGPVLDLTAVGYSLNDVEIGGFTIQGDGTAGAAKKGLALSSTVSIVRSYIHDIAVQSTGGACFDLGYAEINDFVRLVAYEPVNAGTADIPYVIATGAFNGNTIEGLQLYGVSAGANVGVSGAVIIKDNGSTAPHGNHIRTPKIENLHLPTGGTVFALKSNDTVLSDLEPFDSGKVAGGSGTSHIRFQSPTGGVDTGGNVVRGVIPGKGTSATDIDMGIDMQQSRNRVEGVKGFRGTNVVIAVGIGNTSVLLGGAVSGATDPAVIDNSGVLTNTVVDDFSALTMRGARTYQQGAAKCTMDLPGGAWAGGARFYDPATPANGVVGVGTSGARMQSVGTALYFVGDTVQFRKVDLTPAPVVLGSSLTANVTWRSGTGSPEGVVTAAVGSLYSRTDGGAATTLYVKESGTGNTGWIGK